MARDIMRKVKNRFFASVFILRLVAVWMLAAAIVMLVTIYMAADFGGAIPAILVNAPGQPAAAVTAFDGFAMTQLT